jgi:four helix bundle protein
MADQLEGAVISIRNNIGEAQSPQSNRDFISKCKIAQKENFEAEGMVSILTQRDGVTPNQKETLLMIIDEIGRMLTACIVTAKKRSF